jgi:hypothetical protein
MRLCTCIPDQLEQSVGVVAPVGDDMAAFEACEQLRCSA